MKLSDSVAVELLRLERHFVQQRISLAQMPSTSVLLGGLPIGSAELNQVARDAIAAAFESILTGIDGDLRRLGVDPAA